MTTEDKRAFEVVRRLFKNDYGEPFEMTEGQIELFRAIYEKQHPRLQFECYTQYGKSDIVSMAVLLRATTFAEKWIILGGTKDKAEIIMQKVIKHIFENDYCLGKFEINENESLESIKRERSRGRVTFRVDEAGNLGEVMILSADARRKSQDAGDILIGHGGQNLIEDDAALIPDHIHGKALRMLGGHPNNFLLKITNNFNRNHAYRSSLDPKYKLIKINYKRGIKEGRITEEFIEEMRRILDPVMFGILYECEYPPADMVEDGGWMPLLTEDDIKEAQVRSVSARGVKKLGADIAEGTNYNSFVIRQDNYASVKEKTQEKDLMKTAQKILEIAREEFIHGEAIFIDAIGVGAGVASRCKELGHNINAIKTGESPTERSDQEKKLDPIEYYNLRAEIAWKAARWVKEGGALEPHKDWMQLTKLRYKVGEGKTLQLMSKEMMRARGLISPMESPDTADAFMLTFAPNTIIKFTYPSGSTSVKPYYPEIGV